MAAYLTRSDSKEDGDVSSESEEDEESTDCEDGDSDTDWQRYIGYDMLCVLNV